MENEDIAEIFKLTHWNLMFIAIVNCFVTQILFPIHGLWLLNYVIVFETVKLIKKKISNTLKGVLYTKLLPSKPFTSELYTTIDSLEDQVMEGWVMCLCQQIHQQ